MKEMTMSDKMQSRDDVRDSASQTKKKFAEPKLTFVEPTLTKQGDATQITGNDGFFGTFPT
jgi:hypothetical protein